MPRENSFSDEDGRSLTPDLEDEMRENEDHRERPISPTYSHRPIATEPHPRVNHHLASKVMNMTTAGTRFVHTAVTPKDKFRAAVRKVMALHRGTSMLASGNHIGAEPGVDPRRASADAHYDHIKQDCVIEIVDYSSVRSSFGRMTNVEFVNLMGDPAACARDPWVKVRWINIGGMSWDVIKAVSLRYDLHPLALEDIFHTRSQNRSKADYYSKHLFLRILCHELGGPDDISDTLPYSSAFTDAPRSSSPEPMDKRESDALKEREGFGDEERTVYGGSPGSTMPHPKRRRHPLLPSYRRDIRPMFHDTSDSRLSKLVGMNGAVVDARQKREEAEVSLEALKKGERVNVKLSPMFIFLFRDGTVISIHPTPNLEFTSPITRRLRVRDTGLRTSADPSLLVHALLDLIVDRALEVTDAYHTKINKFERAILLKPSMKTVRYLHILSGDLILHKRTLEPIRTLIYGLRRYDLDRCVALIDSSNPMNSEKQVVGFISHKTKIYLADVFDHMEYILTSLDMFAGIAENLINYTFNLASYEMNEVMRRLTLATIIFLPLTLLTGYFGMNFEFMWTIQHGHSDLVFWAIALPVMGIVLPMFLLPDIKNLKHYIQKRMASKNAVKEFKQA